MHLALVENEFSPYVNALSKLMLDYNLCPFSLNHGSPVSIVDFAVTDVTYVVNLKKCHRFEFLVDTNN